MGIKLDSQQNFAPLSNPPLSCLFTQNKHSPPFFYFIFTVYFPLRRFCLLLSSHFNLRNSIFLSFQYLSQKTAQAIDVELMSPTGGGFSFEQLVELGRRPRRQNVPSRLTPIRILDLTTYTNTILILTSRFECRSSRHQGLHQGAVSAHHGLFRARQQWSRWYDTHSVTLVRVVLTLSEVLHLALYSLSLFTSLKKTH